jgi:hypothetical protein
MECCPKGKALLDHLKHHTDELEFYQGCKIRRVGSRTALVFPLRRRAPKRRRPASRTRSRAGARPRPRPARARRRSKAS